MHAYKRSAFIVLIATWTSVGSSESYNDCSVKAITQDCAAFKDEKNPRIDPWAAEAGGIIPATFNVSSGYYGTSTTGVSPATQPMGYGIAPEMAALQSEISEITLRAQMNLLSKLKTGSDAFRFAVSGPNNLQNLAFLLQNENAQPVNYSGLKPEFLLPWPPNKEDAKVKSVHYRVFKKMYWDKLTPSEREAFQAEMKPLLNKMEEQQKSNAEIYKKSLEQAKAKAMVETAEKKMRREDFADLKRREMVRFKRLFEESKRLLLAELRERPFEDQANIIKRIELIELRETVKTASCAADALNANYDPTLNLVTMCSGMSTLPDENLLFILGHELGHAIDPCGCRNSIHRASVGAATLQKDLRPQIDVGMSKIGSISIFETWDKGSQVVAANVLFTDASVKAAVEKGTLTPVLDPIMGAYPFDTTLRCLTTQHGFANTESQSNELVDKRVNRNPEMRVDADNKKYLKSCLNADRSEMTETMSDVFGTKVLGRYLKENPKKRTANDLLQASYLFAKITCQSKPARMGRHIPSKERIEKVLLSESSISSAYNCKPHPKYFCMNKFGSVGAGNTKESGARK